MVSITQTWETDKMSDATDVSTVDDKTDEQWVAIDQRLRNGGHYWPTGSTNADEGVHHTTTDHYNAGGTPKFIIFNSTRTTPVLEISDTYIDAKQLLKSTKLKTIVIPQPESGDNVSAGYFNDASTISKVVAVIQGSTSVTWNLYHGSDRSATGTAVWTTDKTTSNTTTGDTYTTFDNANIAAGSHLWVKVNGISGTPNEITITVYYKED